MSLVEQFNEYRTKMSDKIAGFSTVEVYAAVGVASLIGWTIVIPHLWGAFESWEERQNV